MSLGAKVPKSNVSSTLCSREAERPLVFSKREKAPFFWTLHVPGTVTHNCSVRKAFSPPILHLGPWPVSVRGWADWKPWFAQSQSPGTAHQAALPWRPCSAASALPEPSSYREQLPVTLLGFQLLQRPFSNALPSRKLQGFSWLAVAPPQCHLSPLRHNVYSPGRTTRPVGVVGNTLLP